MMEKNRKNTLGLILAAVVLFIYFFKASAWSEVRSWSERRDISNIMLYMIGIILFFVVAIIGSWIENRIIPHIKNAWYVERVAAMLLLIGGGGYYLYRSYILDTPYPYEYLRNVISGFIYFIVLAFCVMISAIAIKNTAVQSKSLRIIFSMFIAFLQAWFLYSPNVFLDDLGGWYHADAYTNSIINALNYSPFEQYSKAIYGFYAIIYMIPVKLLQLIGFNQWIAVTLAIAIVGGVVFLIEYWVLSFLVDNDILFILAVLANSVVSTQIYFNQFYQLLPHRYVFQAILLAGILYTGTRENRSRKIFKAITWVLAGIAIVWSIEIGVVCAGVCMLGSIYFDAEQSKRYTFKIIMKNIVQFLLTFVGAYGFVNIYNLLVGGNVISVRTFLWPISSDVYMFDIIQSIIYVPWMGYFLPILILLCTLGYYLERIVKIDLNIKELIVVLAAVMGIGVYTYYMSRTVSSNTSIISFTFIVVLAYIIDRNIKREKTKIVERISVANVGSIICLIVLVSMALSSVSYFGHTLHRKLGSTYETDSLDQFIEEVERKIPDETVAFGMGTAQLFSYMDRDTGIYMADWEDMADWDGNCINPEALEYLQQQLENNEYRYILVNVNQAEHIPKQYELVDEFQYSSIAFALYENKTF